MRGLIPTKEAPYDNFPQTRTRRREVAALDEIIEVMHEEGTVNKYHTADQEFIDWIKARAESIARNILRDTR